MKPLALNIPERFQQLTQLTIEREIARSARSVVYLATKNGENYALKLPSYIDGREYQSDWLLYRREASFLARLNHPGLLKVHAVGKADSIPFLVYEFVNGRTLADAVKRATLNKEQICKVATGLLGALNIVHESGLIHRDIKPDNILLSNDFSPLLIDFGLATSNRQREPSEEILGTLLYSSPEQSGMVQRPVDRRSDLYSLGVVLYECATGGPPFIADDAGKLMRLHATRLPTSIRASIPTFSPALDQIILKLLAKEPDERYQTAQGALNDLLSIDALEDILLQGKGLTLGSQDEFSSYSNETNLIGREEELSKLNSLWRDARTGEGRVLSINGESGSGKTRLIREFLNQRSSDGTLLLQSKCAQKKQRPFGAVRDSINDLCDWIVSLSADKQAVARTELDTALSGLTTDERDILGTLSIKLSTLVLTRTDNGQKIASQEQLYGIVTTFFVAFVKRHGPTVIFIDDIQWLDEASFQVLRRLVEEINDVPIFLVFASRTGVSDGAAMLTEFSRLIPYQIKLGLLNEQQTTTLIRTHLGGLEIHPDVVRRIFVRSHGNAFAVGEYLRSIVDKGLLWPYWGTWLLDPEEVDKMQLPEDLAQLILKRIEDLDKTTLRIIAVAALISHKDYLRILPGVCETNAAAVHAAIEQATAAHVIEKIAGSTLNFVHDKVQEALIHKLTLAEKQIYNQRIAETLAINAPQEPEPEYIYALAQHYYWGQLEISTKEAHKANLLAAKTALGEYAVEESYHFFLQADNIGTRLNTPFPSEYFGARAQACISTGRSEEAIEYLLKTIHLAKDLYSKVNLRVDLARVYIANREVNKTWEQLHTAYSELNYRSTHHPVIQITKAICYVLKFKFLKPFWGAERTAKEMDRLRLFVRCYEVGMPAAYFAGDVAFIVNGCLHIRPALKLGITRELSFVLSLYGCVSALVKRSKKAKILGKKGCEVALATGDHLSKARASVWESIIDNIDGKWQESENKTQKLMREVNWIDATDYLNLGGCLAFQTMSLGNMETCLETVRLLTQRLTISQAQIGLRDSVKYHPYLSFQLVALALQGLAKNAFDFVQNCKKQIELHPADRFGANLYFSCLTGFCYETEEFGQAAETAIAEYRRRDLNRPFWSNLHTKHFYVYQAYIRFEQCMRAGTNLAPYLKLLKTAVSELKSAMKIPDCPVLRAHLYVVSAALQFVKNKPRNAFLLLDKADEQARNSNSPLARFEALRLRARILKFQGAVASANAEAQLAFDIALHHGWVERSRWIITEFQIRRESTGISTQTLEKQDGFQQSNLRLKRHEGALLKVGLAVGSKLEPMDQCRSALDELIKALGAERAFMFEVVDEQKHLNLMLGRGSNQEDLASLEAYSRTVVEMVSQTRRPVIVTADEQGKAAYSESITSQNLKSIIAAPMLVEDNFEGVVYLDNRLVRGVFTREDMQLLQSISNQIAVARKSVRIALHLFEKRNLQSNLDKFLPRNIVNQIMSGSIRIDEGPRHLATTILFSDLVGFTKLLASISASDATTILNKYLDRMINVIFEHEGTIDKFIGDAIMVIFGAPLQLPPDEQVKRAIACASGMQSELEILNREWRKDLEIDLLQMRIGIHHGPVLIGNFGNDRRLQYTALGNTVNLAARIQSACEPGQVYFSQVVCDYVSSTPTRKVGAFTLKGLDGPINLYTIANDEHSKK